MFVFQLQEQHQKYALLLTLVVIVFVEKSLMV